MNQREKTIWITRTAAFLALLVVLQAATAPEIPLSPGRWSMRCLSYL